MFMVGTAWAVARKFKIRVYFSCPEITKHRFCDQILLFNFFFFFMKSNLEAERKLLAYIRKMMQLKVDSFSNPLTLLVFV